MRRGLAGFDRALSLRQGHGVTLVRRRYRGGRPHRDRVEDEDAVLPVRGVEGDEPLGSRQGRAADRWLGDPQMARSRSRVDIAEYGLGGVGRSQRRSC